MNKNRALHSAFAFLAGVSLSFAQPTPQPAGSKSSAAVDSRIRWQFDTNG